MLQASQMLQNLPEDQLVQSSPVGRLPHSHLKIQLLLQNLLNLLSRKHRFHRLLQVLQLHHLTQWLQTHLLHQVILIVRWIHLTQ